MKTTASIYTDDHKKKQPNLSATKKRKMASWLRKHISGIDGGIQCRKPDGTIYCPHLNTNQRTIEFLNAMSQGQQPNRWLDRLKNEDFFRHFDGHKTFYFSGAGQRSAEHTLVMIDVDVLKSLGQGSTSGALAFIKHIKKKFLPNLYYEQSTGGNGIHGYFVVEKNGDHPAFINKVLREFQAPL